LLGISTRVNLIASESGEHNYKIKQATTEKTSAQRQQQQQKPSFLSCVIRRPQATAAESAPNRARCTRVAGPTGHRLQWASPTWTERLCLRSWRVKQQFLGRCSSCGYSVIGPYRRALPGRVPAALRRRGHVCLMSNLVGV